MTVNIEGSSANNKKVIGKCPKCNTHDVIESTKGYGCSGYKDNSCDFTIWKTQFGGTVSIENAKLLIEGKETEEIKFHSKAKGSDYNAKLKLKDDFTTELIFGARKEPKSIGKCPICKDKNIDNNIIENSKAFGCSGYKDGCKFAIWKNTNGTTISEDEAKALLSGKPLVNKKCLSKDNKPYTATLVLENNKLTTKFD